MAQNPAKNLCFIHSISWFFELLVILIYKLYRCFIDFGAIFTKICRNFVKQNNIAQWFGFSRLYPTIFWSSSSSNSPENSSKLDEALDWLIWVIIIEYIRHARRLTTTERSPHMLRHVAYVSGWMSGKLIGSIATRSTFEKSPRCVWACRCPPVVVHNVAQRLWSMIWLFSK